MIEWIVSSCVLILLALLVRALLKNGLSARLRYALWALVLVRLLVPVTPVNSPLSLWNLVQSAEPAAYAPADDPAPPGNWSGGGMSDPSESSAVRSDSLPQAGPAWEAAPVDRTSPGQQPGPALSPARILTALWLGGAAALALILLWSNLSFLRRLRR